MQLALVRETWQHMSDTSGLVPLFKELERVDGIGVTNFEVPSRVPKNALLKRAANFFRGPVALPSSPSPFVSARHESIATRLLQYAEESKSGPILLTVGENQYGGILSHASARLRSRMFVIFHQPPSWLRLHWTDFSTLDGLAGIFCFGKHLGEYLKSVTSTPVHCVHHGVHLDFFKPNHQLLNEEDTRIVFVGEWLRDFQVLSESMRLVWREMPKVHVDCVVPRHGRQSPALLRLARDARVHWYAGLTPEELRGLYQRAKLLFLPLIDSVANNALNEALACGLPIVSTRVGDVCQYAPEGAATLCECENPADHARGVIEWLTDSERIANARSISRGYAEKNLNWSNIASNLAAIMARSHGQ